MACLYVAFLNGAPLFRYDTFAYLNRGLFLVNMVSDFLGFGGTDGFADAVAGATESNRVLDGTPAVGEQTISASRSRVYSLIIGVFASFELLEATLLLHTASVLVAVWLPVRIAARQFNTVLPVAPTVAIPLMIAGLGSLPFYIPYLMADIYAPVGILTVATLAVFLRDMTKWEILLSVILGCLAVTAHISHLAIAAALIPVVALVSWGFGRLKWWLAPLLVSLIVGFGYVELSSYRVAVKAKTDMEAVFMPFLTARLIQDRVGYDYLAEHCPDPEIATCDLFAALSKSDDPMRLTASNIMFRTSERLGSFLHLSEVERKHVNEEQFTFFRDVMLDKPIRSVGALLKNTLYQARMNSVDMTLTTTDAITYLIGVKGLAMGNFGSGRLTRDVSWLKPVTKIHNVLYGASLLVIALMVSWPGAMPSKIKALVIIILLGILANAFICGALSQPASRYGSRVIWLLPLAAGLCVLHASFLLRRSSQG